MTKTIGVLSSNLSSNTTIQSSPLSLTSFISVINPISTTFAYTITSDITNNFTVNWGDGTAIQSFGNVAEIAHVYPLAGVEYTIIIDGLIAGITPFTKGDLIKVLRCAGSFKTLDSMCRNCVNLTEFDTTGLNNSSLIAGDFAWAYCTSLVKFNCIGFRNVSPSIVLINAWNGCSSLTSFDTTGMEKVRSIGACWSNSGLTSFDANGLRSVLFCESAWFNCTGLTNFNTSGLMKAINCQSAWASCTGLTSFNSCGLRSIIDCSNAWRDCSGLINFDASGLIWAENISEAWFNCTSLQKFLPRTGVLAFVTNTANYFTNVPFSIPIPFQQ